MASKIYSIEVEPYDNKRKTEDPSTYITEAEGYNKAIMQYINVLMREQPIDHLMVYYEASKKKDYISLEEPNFIKI